MKYIIKNINDYSKNEIKNFYNNLSKSKKDKIDKYKNEATKTRSIIGEIILSELLQNNNIEYIVNEYGKPYLKDSDIFFNISHSYDYVICAISNKEIGIDIEKIRPTNIINQIATDNEKEYILSGNINERTFEIFTLKEAYFKMLGKNLNDILNVEFTIKENAVYCSDNSVNTGFIKDIDGYIISYCEKK